MPPWSCDRVSQTLPFQFVGLYYLGPVYVKANNGLDKNWICLFTCLSVRAIHLEWVMDLTATQLFNCLQRFVSRRGKPDSIISDNASQFKLTSTVSSKQWKKVFIDKEVFSYVVVEDIKWNITTVLAPWQGAFMKN